MKVFFVNPSFKTEYGKFSRENRSPAITRSGTLYYPLWLISAAAVCEKAGFDVEFLDSPAEGMSYEEEREYLIRHGQGTRLFVINTSTPSIYNDVKLCETIKQIFPDAYNVLVGTHPSALPKETLLLSQSIDAVARHEYDYTIRDLAYAIDRDLDIQDVKGITFRKNDQELMSNEDRPFIENLDELPFTSEFIFKHLNYKNYFFAAGEYPEMQIFTGRGCIAHCNFCVYPQTMHGHIYRKRSSKSIIDELMYIKNCFPDIKEIVFEDDTFTADKQRTIDFCELLISTGLNKRFRWLCNARVNLDYETMVKMKEAGCHLIIPGIESGSQIILNNIKKGTTVEQVKKYISNAKKAKLKVHACYMIGNKGENVDTMKQTLQLAMELNTDTAQFYPLLPFPGTEAYVWALSNNYIRGTFADYVKQDGTINSLLELPELSSKQMVDFCDYARRKYYVRMRYILYRLKEGILDFQDLKRSIKAFVNIKQYLLRK